MTQSVIIRKMQEWVQLARKNWLTVLGAVAIVAYLLARPALFGGDVTAAAAAPSTLAQIESDTVAPQVRPSHADVTMVVFSDYQCPFCRKLHPEVRKLLAEDHRIHFIYRDWPIFGDASVEAARLAIASQYQGRHEAFDQALMKTSGKLDNTKIRSAADQAGVDWTRLQSDLAAHRQDIDGLLVRTDRYAQALGFQGTPGIVVGRYAMFGAQDLDGLKKAVAKARQNP